MGPVASLSENVTLIVCALVAAFLVHRTVVYARLRRFRGPRWTGWTDWPHSRAIMGKTCHEWYAAVSDEYGRFLL